MDELLLRARMHALEMAHMQHGFTTDGYTDAVLSIAAEYEAWLTRPTPVPAVTHDAETTADRLGYQRCPTTWRTEDGAGHLCVYPPGHEERTTGDREHRCSCGDVLDASATKR